MPRKTENLNVTHRTYIKDYVMYKGQRDVSRTESGLAKKRHI